MHKKMKQLVYGPLDIAYLLDNNIFEEYSPIVHLGI